MLTACKQPGLHQTITLMFMLLGLEISKALRERVFEKKLPEKNVPQVTKKSIKSFTVRKIRYFFCYHPSELSPRVR